MINNLANKIIHPIMFDTLYNLSLDYKTPVFCTIAYILYSINTNNKLKNEVHPTRKLSSLLTLVMIFHNISLCVFSFLTFVNMLPIVTKFIFENSLYVIIVDPHKELLLKIEFWIWIFYVSKIYEIMDSFILHWNKKKTSFLQIYHHSGAIVCCYMLATCNSHLAWIFIVLNSFIHTLMYFYYLLMTIRVIVPRVLKQTITRLQIVQFVSGASLLILHVVYGQDWDDNYNMKIFQYATLAFNLVYVSILFVLFKRFEKRAYKAEQKEKTS